MIISPSSLSLLFSRLVVALSVVCPNTLSLSLPIYCELRSFHFIFSFPFRCSAFSLSLAGDRVRREVKASISSLSLSLFLVHFLVRQTRNRKKQRKKNPLFEPSLWIWFFVFFSLLNAEIRFRASFRFVWVLMRSRTGKVDCASVCCLAEIQKKKPKLFF